ncbi:hypothetical protein [Salinivibrio kushneri]|uniref:hypothetical protein n=1 Tax=Salinivibrio kushneri TaxID=1908198 RepID=UPI00098845A4|nr:hypothetical protein [Salinivibrio kushneri]OOE32418.1 hypothetical protein BZG04_15255 [Salinivibrio kushneri]OOE49299.1 hypothetical protein BZG12_16035 [Salinivibrio kushneri]
MVKKLSLPLFNLMASLVPELSQAQPVVQLVKAFNVHRGRHRAEKLAQGLELAWSYMDESDQKHFEALCNNPHFQEQVAEYMEAALNTPSEIVIKAIALLMLNDPDCRLDDAQKERFVRAFEGLSNEKVVIFLALCDLDRTEQSIYDIYEVSHDKPVKNYENEPERILLTFSDLLNRGLVSPDIRKVEGAGAFFADLAPNTDGQWSISFGLTEEQKSYSRLLDKAKTLNPASPSTAASRR